MAPSPERDPLRDAEARIRALTREVGSLREELRRETKRRERAVVQVGTLLVPLPSEKHPDGWEHASQVQGCF
jgi:hypothetical protein